MENSSCWKVGLRIQLPSTRPTRTAAMGPFHGTARQAERGRGGQSTPSMSASFSWSADSTVHEDLDFVLESLREERPDGAVDHAAGEDLLVRGPALALEEPARDLARGVGLLAIFDREREEGKRGDVGETVTAARTTVSPKRTSAEPAACLARRPDSMISGRPANCVSIRCTLLTFAMFGTRQYDAGAPGSSRGARGGSRQVSGGDPAARSARGRSPRSLRRR